jgi:hypothetical protein
VDIQVDDAVSPAPLAMPARPIALSEQFTENHCQRQMSDLLGLDELDTYTAIARLSRI